jgi:transposase
VVRGRIESSPPAIARWVTRFAGRELHVALEACTGWLFVCDALVGAGAVAHLAEPVETSPLRGRKRRAKTDREDARWLRELLADGRLPEAWIPPEHVRQWRSRSRLRHTLIDERTQWLQRIQATLFHHGVSGTPERSRTSEGRAFLEQLPLPADARERIEIAVRMIDAIEAQIAPLERELRQLARRQTGCRALMRLYGMDELTSLVTLCELGDVGRLSASRKAVRMAGIDIGVHRSDRRSRVGKLNRQGSPQLRWALYEAALAACRPSSPDHADYLALKARGLSHTRASLTARPPLLPRPARARARRPGARPDPLTPNRRPLRSRPHSAMTFTLPAGSRSYRGSHTSEVAAHQRPSGRSHSTRTDRSTITSPTHARSRTQISPGIHGDDRHPDHHNHSPPHRLT